ncbi:hypothetical protein Pmar_PMAR010534, partial [Perkinsus marinus ATCC 50983]
YCVKLLDFEKYQFRERQKQNKSVLDKFHATAKIEACSNGDWLTGEVVDVLGPTTNRVRVKCRLEDGSIEEIPLGMVVLKSGENDDWDDSEWYGAEESWYDAPAGAQK